MADQLLTGTTLVENTSRSSGDIAIGGIIEFDETYNSIPEGFLACNGSVVNDPLSSYNGATLPNYNTNYWSCNSTNFVLDAGGFSNAANYNFVIADGYLSVLGAGTKIVGCPVSLPHGAIITGAVVYSGASGEDQTWTLRRMTSGGTISTIASALCNTEDITISNAIVDNATYNYSFMINAATGDYAIWGARITYTTRKKFIIRIR